MTIQGSRETYETMWGYQCQGCDEWYPRHFKHSCAGAADGLPLTDLSLERGVLKMARALERIAAALEIGAIE